MKQLSPTSDCLRAVISAGLISLLKQDTSSRPNWGFPEINCRAKISAHRAKKEFSNVRQQLEKWEYNIEPINTLEEEIEADIYLKINIRLPAELLHQKGEQGWELVGFHGEDAWFKRIKVSKDDAQLLFEE